MGSLPQAFSTRKKLLQQFETRPPGGEVAIQAESAFAGRFQIAPPVLEVPLRGELLLLDLPGPLLFLLDLAFEVRLGGL